MKNNPHYERTLVIIKPDGIQRGLIGEIIQRYERVGLKLTGMKLMTPTRELIEQHYTLDPSWRQKTGEKTIESYIEKGMTPPESDPLKVTEILLRRLADYMTKGPVIAMIWEGAHAVAIVRKITGGTEPLSSDVGTIRGDYVLDSYRMTDSHQRAVRNLVHASGSVKEAEDEIGHWFASGEVVDYRLAIEKILYDADMGTSA